MDLGLEGKTAVVTGASTGIGYGIAKQFLLEGANVALIARNKDKLTEAVKSLVTETGVDENKLCFVCADMTDKNAVFKMADQVYEKYHGLDIWINNVGATGMKKGESYSEQEVDFVLHTCFSSAVYGCEAAYRYLKKQGGSIVNISSLAARCPSAGRSTLYGPMKAALVNLTQTMAGEYCADQIRVNCVMPGFTLTPLVQKTISEEELTYNINGTLLRRIANPEDIAKPVVFLASQAAGYMTGTTIEVSGGRSVTLNPDFAWKKGGYK